MTVHEIPLAPIRTDRRGQIPTDHQCLQWWDQHGMLEHIKRHSLLVARVATVLAELAVMRGRNPLEGAPADDFVQSVRAAALLHDLGKTHAIKHGGNHSQIGAAWVMELTANPAIAQGVIHHVHWPGSPDLERHFLPLAVIYADKRVKHDTLVSVDDRYQDLMDRYGKNERSRVWITKSRLQCIEIENLLSSFLGENIHAYPFDRGRLVR